MDAQHRGRFRDYARPPLRGLSVADDAAPRAHISTFAIPGMDCPSEEQLVRMALRSLPEVVDLSFDLSERQLLVRHGGAATEILDRLTPLGFGASLIATEERQAGELHSDHVTSAAGGQSGERRVLWAVLWINAGMFVIELATGIIAGSTGLLADSLDMLADAAIYAIALIAVGQVHQRQRRAARTSGWLQLALACVVLVEVVRRALAGEAPEPAVMIIVGLLALTANLACVMLLARHRAAGAHMRASWIFTTNDTLANLGVVVAGVLVAVTETAWPDLVIGTAIAVLVASGAWRILRMPG